MDEFFHGWRRKVGAVMLLMALAFVGGWVRSMSIEDNARVSIDSIGAVGIWSVNGSFAFCLGLGWEPTHAVWSAQPWDRVSWHDMDGYAVSPSGVRLGGRFGPDGTRWESDNFVPPPRDADEPKFILYRNVVILLTLLSAYLLLIKPRSPRPKKNENTSDIVHRWRLRMGVITLVTACTFTGWWVRSFVVQDFINFQTLTKFANEKHAFAGIRTERHSLVLMKLDRVIVTMPAQSSTPAVNVPSAVAKPEITGIVESRDINLPELLSEPTPMAIATLKPIPFLVVPFWTVVVPLFLFSVCLLFIRPLIAGSNRGISSSLLR